jgi:acyl carrier protein
LPLTANGKVDRAALPALHAPAREVETSEDELATAVAEMVAGLLGLDAVGADENFLLLGGHSLLGAQLVTRLADQFGVEVSLLALFDHPTPSGMADVVRELLIEQVSALDDDTAALLAASE